MIKVGVTGGIGSGKSIICKVFSIMGIPVFFSDIEAKKLLTNPKVIEFYRKEIGQPIFDENNNIDKRKLAQILFADKNLLEKVNSFIHPIVNEMFEKWCKEQYNPPYVIKESAILIERELYKNLDYIILVVSDINERINRIIERDKLSKEEILKRINNQWNDEKKMNFANAVIYNNPDNPVIPQVLEIHDKLLLIK